ncbi:MAG TPA: DUF1330 domain-containing protein [Acidimicrobiia bacterium]|nr:DUF1330 domain-containing protein [Acidimicrobiia bacterium]
MSAYVLVEIEVIDPEAYAEYMPLAEASVKRHGGRYIARGGLTETFEGAWAGRIVILEFESLDAARAWYHSADYQACLPVRLNTSQGRMIALDGLDQ